MSAGSEIPQQSFDILQLELGTEVLAEAPPQFFENATRALHINLAGHFDRGVVAIVTPAQRPAQWIGVLLRARQAKPAGLAVRTGAKHSLLLHRLCQILRTASQCFERAAL